MVADAMGGTASRISNSMSSYGRSSGYFNEGNSSGNPGFMKDKLAGK
jgi:hypothetical protein